MPSRVRFSFLTWPCFVLVACASERPAVPARDATVEVAPAVVHGTPVDVPGDVPDDVRADVPVDTAVDVAVDVTTDVVADVPGDDPVDAPVDVPAVDAGTPTNWARNVGDRGTDTVDDVAVDYVGNVYVTGRFGAPTTGATNDDMFIASFGPDGTSRWMHRHGGASNDGGKGVALDRDGNVYVTGYFGGSVDFGGGPLTSNGGLDVFLVSYTSTGAHRWSRRYGGRYADNGTGVAADEDGNVYVSAVISAPADFGGGELRPPTDAHPALVLASYNASGAYRWARVMGGRYLNVTGRVATAPDGDALLAGTFNYSIDLGGGSITGHTGTDGFVARYAPDGRLRWARNYGGSASIAFVVPERVAADASGNVYATGVFNAGVSFGTGSPPFTGYFDVFLLALTPAGVYRWASIYTGPDTDRAHGLAVGADGNVAITGFFNRSVDFGGGPLTSAGSYDIFLASYTSAGLHQWSRRLGSASFEESHALATDRFGGLVVAGTFRATTSFGATSLTPTGSDDGFVYRFTQD